MLVTKLPKNKDNSRVCTKLIFALALMPAPAELSLPLQWVAKRKVLVALLG